MKTTPYNLRHGMLKIHNGRVECIPSKKLLFLDSKHVENVARPSSSFNMAGEQKNKIIDNKPNQKSNCLISPPLKSANYQDAESTPAASLLTQLGVDMI